MKILGSISFNLTRVLIGLLVVATILEKLAGTQVVSDFIYHSPVFIALWAAVVFSGIVYLVYKKQFKKRMAFGIHLSFVVILLGALVTFISSESGQVHLRTDEVKTSYVNNFGREVNWPFGVTLKQFQVLCYPGTQTPQDFVSQLQFTDDNMATSEIATVSMNRVASYQGYRFYQSGYDNDSRGTRLTISYDPYGIAITYTGYVLLLLTFIGYFFSKKSQWRMLLNSPILKSTAVVIVLWLMSVNLQAASQPKVLPVKAAEEFCDLCVLYNGRICPLQTLARDFTMKLYGKTSFQSYSAEQVFTGWLFFYTSWNKQPMIKIKSQQVQKALGVDTKYICYNDFANRSHQYKLSNWREQLPEDSNQATQKAFAEADEKFNIVRMLFAGKLSRIFPYVDDKEQLQWYASGDALPGDMDENTWMFIRKAMDYAAEFALVGDSQKFTDFTQKVKAYQQKTAGAVLPSPLKLKAEKCYNAMASVLWLAITCMLIGIGLFLYSIRRTINHKKWHQQVFIISIAGVVAVFMFLSFRMLLRTFISGHLPVTNGFETMQFLAWSILLLSLLLHKRFLQLLPFGFILCGLSLMVSVLGQSNPKITQLMPVLSSPLLSIHVVSIMISYALMAFMMMNGITALVLKYTTADSTMQLQRLQVISQIILYPAVFFMAAGIFIGAVWANMSWGRYWGWDPKEVWALITLLIYALALHTKSLTRFQKPMYFHWFSVIAFISVLFTYFGVNFLLGGLHSYAG